MDGSTIANAIDDPGDEFCYREMFQSFQHELDCRNDKYERLVKLSRDITIESKRIIFQLHRVFSSANTKKTLSDAQCKISWLQKNKWRYVAEELQNEDPYQFIRAYSPGLQEYIESLSFLHYLMHGSLISLEAVASSLQFTVEAKADRSQSKHGVEGMSCDVTLSVNVPPLEYMMGIADLTGELMRLAISSVAYTSPSVESVANNTPTNAADLPEATKAAVINIKTDKTTSSTAPIMSSVTVVDCTEAASHSSSTSDQKTPEDLSPFTICRFLQAIQIAFSAISGSASRELNRKLVVMKQCERKVEAACYALKVRGSEMPKHLIADSLSRVAVNSSGFDGNEDYNDCTAY